MKDFKVVTQKKGKYYQKILNWYEGGERKRKTIPKPLWYLIDEANSLEEIRGAIHSYKENQEPRQRKSNRRVKGEGSGVIQRRICKKKNKDGTTKRYTQYWFQFEQDGKRGSRYIPVAMVDTITEMNVRKVSVSLILQRLD
ncbi:MAG: hypothetical protein IGQ45_10230 [Cyanobacterium sp. T60_A2020_053]|nr:hypothetical protein [Cyanobacterium sp. T60_A2020_053]